MNTAGEAGEPFAYEIVGPDEAVVYEVRGDNQWRVNLADAPSLEDCLNRLASAEALAGLADEAFSVLREEYESKPYYTWPPSLEQKQQKVLALLARRDALTASESGEVNE